MSAFRQALAAASKSRGSQPAEWVFVAYDQLTSAIGPLAEKGVPRGALFIESRWKAAQRPYCQQKLVLLLASMRQFALELARQGTPVRYLHVDTPYRPALELAARELGPLLMMEAAERELRQDLAPLTESGVLQVVPHAGWLTSSEDFRASQQNGRWRMDRFYRTVRRRTGILMEGNSPLGGKFSHDVENRLPWKGEPVLPLLPKFDNDAIDQEVIQLVREEFSHHPGSIDEDHLPTQGAQVEAAWEWAKRECLEHFGPFEDAMTLTSTTLFHTRISALLNLHRLLPSVVVDDVVKLSIPLPSKEGFVRQVLGWREFMRHVHRETDGFRSNGGEPVNVLEAPGDGGFRGWSGSAFAARTPHAEGGAAPNHLGAHRAVPPALWGRSSGLTCLDTVVREVWSEGYGHHITRLMVLSNLATLLDIDPRQLTDWFWIAYADAYDWVVEPNVLGMGTFATADLFTTKPYVSGTPYLHKMSDYCDQCRFHPKKTCPISNLYWDFLARHENQLGRLPRMRMPYISLRKRSEAQRKRDTATFEWVTSALAAGAPLDPADLP